MAAKSRQRAKGWSAPATSLCVLDLLSDLQWQSAVVAKVGVGRGHFSQLLCDDLRIRDLSFGSTLNLTPHFHSLKIAGTGGGIAPLGVDLP